MSQQILSATVNQRKNLLALVGYLLSIKDTDKAHDYDHSDEERCSFGQGVRGKKIKALNSRFTVSADGKSYHKRASFSSRYTSDLADAVFGEDYWTYIVYGPYNSNKHVCGGVKDKPTGREQLVYIIDALIKAYAMTPEELAPYTPATVTVTKEVDTTKNRIKARIKKLEDFVIYASAFDDDDVIDLTASVKAAQADIKALRRALAI